MKPKLILASASPRRKELLEMVGLDFEVIPSDAAETFLKREAPREHALRLSREKAFAVGRIHSDGWVLGADTIVLAGGEILGKPRNRNDARDMLGKLSGRAHKVITGFTLLKDGNPAVISEAVETIVIFKELSPGEIEWYSGTKEPYDKAGGYAVQGMGASFIKEIRGSYTNVVGLPLCEVVEALKKVGAAKVC
jgi:septum formation protein